MSKIAKVLSLLLILSSIIVLGCIDLRPATITPYINQISNIATGVAYNAEPLAIGKHFYTDRNYIFTSIPSKYIGLDYIKTSDDDRYLTTSNYLQFNVDTQVTVYIAYDDRISPKASWLSSFIDTGDNLMRNGTSTFSIYSRDYAPGQVILSGTSIVAGGKGGAYIVIVKPLPTSTIISNIKSIGVNSYVTNILAIGKPLYTDRIHTFTNLPSNYIGLDYIEPPNNDRYGNDTVNNFLQFDVNVPVTVYIAYNDRISPKASWISTFTDTGDNLVRSDNISYDIYSKNYPAGHISLAGNGILQGSPGGMYIVIVKPTTSTNPTPTVTATVTATATAIPTATTTATSTPPPEQPDPSTNPIVKMFMDILNWIFSNFKPLSA